MTKYQFNGQSYGFVLTGWQASCTTLHRKEIGIFCLVQTAALPSFRQPGHVPYVSPRHMSLKSTNAPSSRKPAARSKVSDDIIIQQCTASSAAASRPTPAYDATDTCALKCWHSKPFNDKYPRRLHEGYNYTCGCDYAC